MPLCLLVMTMLQSLIIWTLYLEKIDAQSLSHSCPIDMKEPVLRLLMMWPCCVWSERWGNIWIATVCDGFIYLL